MKRRPACIGLVLILAVAVPTPSFAWNAAGHRIIAFIAYRRLSEPAKAKLLAILKQHPRLENEFKRPRDVSEADYGEWMVTQAAVWPDLIRSKRPWDHPTWHYINQPLYLTDADRDALKDRLKVNINWKFPKDGDQRSLNVVQALRLGIGSPFFLRHS